MDREMYDLLAEMNNGMKNMQSDIQSLKSEMNSTQSDIQSFKSEMTTEMKSMKTDVQMSNLLSPK